jgi:translation elongation factor EF-G
LLRLGAVILEPIMKMEVITPRKQDIVGDINRRRGQVNDEDGVLKLLRQMFIEMFGYVTTLRTLSSEQHLLWNFHITRKLLLIFQKQ